MKIAKVSLLALSIAAAGSVFAQAAGPDQNTLVACNNQIYDCDITGKVHLEESRVDDRIKGKSYVRKIYVAKARPVKEKDPIYIVQEETTKQEPVVVTGMFVVVPQGLGNPWAYVPK